VKFRTRISDTISHLIVGPLIGCTGKNLCLPGGWQRAENAETPQKKVEKKIDEPTHHQSPNEGVGFKGPLLGEDPILLELPYSILLWGWAETKKNPNH